jgi:hypothetical protein
MGRRRLADLDHDPEFARLEGKRFADGIRLAGTTIPLACAEQLARDIP